MCFRAWIARLTRQELRDDVYAGEDWKQDSFRQFMNTLRARYLFARSQLSEEDKAKRKDVIEEIERVFKAWGDSEASARQDDSLDVSEEAAVSQGQPGAVPVSQEASDAQ